MSAYKKLLATAALAAVVLGTAGCGATAGSSEPADDKTSLKIGFNPGPYREQFEQGIVPILEDEGFSTESLEFTDGIVVNVALSAGEIDANIMQHPVFMASVNEQENLDNTALVQVPGPPMALFGGKSTTLDVADGATVAVPNQPSNMYRAFRVLEGEGWLELSDDIDPATASPADVTGNPYNLQILPIENAQQVASLQDVDYSVIQGNFVVSGGLKLADALALEDLTDDFSVVVAVDAANIDTPWAKAIKEAYESDAFAEYIASNAQYDGYHLPAALER